MKLPKFLKDKRKVLVLMLLIFIVVGTVGGRYYLAQKENNQESQGDTQTSQEEQDRKNENSKIFNNRQGSTTPTPSQNPDSPTSSNDKLAQVSVKGILLQDQNNAIETILVAPTGEYRVEKKVNESWIFLGNYTVAGTEKSLADQIPISETERVYRIYKLEDNKIGPKEILVDRNLIVSKGGENNFPGAL